MGSMTIVATIDRVGTRGSGDETGEKGIPGAEFRWGKGGGTEFFSYLDKTGRGGHGDVGPL